MMRDAYQSRRGENVGERWGDCTKAELQAAQSQGESRGR